MLPEVGGTELLVIAAVALIVVGPKDLPQLLRKLGQFVAKLRSMADDFRASFDEMARQSELDDLRKEVEAMRRGQFMDQANTAALNSDVTQVFHEIGDSLGPQGLDLHPGVTYEAEALAETAPAPAKPKRVRKAATVTGEAAPAKTPRKRTVKVEAAS